MMSAYRTQRGRSEKKMKNCMLKKMKMILLIEKKRDDLLSNS